MLGLGGNFFKSILYFCSALGLQAFGFERRQFMPVHVFLPPGTPMGGRASAPSGLSVNGPHQGAGKKMLSA